MRKEFDRWPIQMGITALLFILSAKDKQSRK